MRAFSLLPLIAALAASCIVWGGEVSIQLPPETDTYKTAPGSELAQTFCLQCHSVEYISSQPPMPRKFWEASVVKMKDKYGAPVPPELVGKLTDYLVATYGVPATVPK